GDRLLLRRAGPQAEDLARFGVGPGAFEVDALGLLELKVPFVRLAQLSSVTRTNPLCTPVGCLVGCLVGWSCRRPHIGSVHTMNLGDFDALSFDCYGTLIDWETGLLAVLRPWADRHGVEASDEDLLAAYSRHEARAEAEHPAQPYPGILARAMRGIGADLGAPVSDEEAASLAGSVPDWPAFPDSAEALERLSRRYELIILSNVDRTSFAGSNERLGVTFTSVITAEDLGSYKPSPRNFEALVREA